MISLWLQHMLLTWLHIAAGMGFVGIVFLAITAYARWYDSIQDQIEKKKGK